LEKQNFEGSVRLRLIRNKKEAGHRWLMPVILPTLEAEIRRIVVRSQTGEIVLKNLS
jgi:hypothetical protein